MCGDAVSLGRFRLRRASLEAVCSPLPKSKPLLRCSATSGTPHLPRRCRTGCQWTGSRGACRSCWAERRAPGRGMATVGLTGSGSTRMYTCSSPIHTALHSMPLKAYSAHPHRQPSCPASAGVPAQPGPISAGALCQLDACAQPRMSAPPPPRPPETSAAHLEGQLLLAQLAQDLVLHGHLGNGETVRREAILCLSESSPWKRMPCMTGGGCTRAGGLLCMHHRHTHSSPCPSGCRCCRCAGCTCTGGGGVGPRTGKASALLQQVC